MPKPSSSKAELDNFLDQWKQEVGYKMGQSNLPPDSPPLRPTSGEDQQAQNARAYSVAKLASKAARQDSASSGHSSALDVYLMANEMERQGKLGQALIFYRRAFKLDPDVDALYLRHCDGQANTDMKITMVPAAPSRQKQKQQDPLVATASANSNDLAAVQRPLYQDNCLDAQNQSNPQIVDPLDVLAYEVSQQDISYKPALDYKPVEISRLPVENLTPCGFAFCVVCCPLCTGLQTVFPGYTVSNVMRHVCVHVFCAPGMTLEQSQRYQAEAVMTQYDGRWLQMYIERPRLHFDGVYISTCQYIRPGESETSAWTQPSHLVTYYRYIRFFSDGTIVKHLSTDAPAQVVRLLSPDFSRRQVFHGRYHFVDPQSIVVEMRDKSRPREKFEMTLQLESTRRGRHNKLVWQKYWSRKDGREEDTLYDLTRMRPFLFRVVRSFRK